MENAELKVWGLRETVLRNKTTEVDLLHLKKDTFCSIHSHEFKWNKFFVISGSVMIETDYDKVILESGHSLVVPPKLKHRFVSYIDSIVLETAWVDEGMLDSNDINRIKLGGRIVKDKFLPLDEQEFNDWEE